MNPKLAACLTLAGLLVLPPLARADEVTDWNAIMLKSLSTGGATPLTGTRFAAIVQSSVFDALNGIERRYTSVHVAPNAPGGASKEAAVAQAAYAALVGLFPAQQPALAVRLAASLDAIHGSRNSIDKGVAWGQSVANQILAWRATDGITPPPPPYTGGLNPGQWRPTPPLLLPSAAPQFATMIPWVLNAPSQFRPSGPPALTSLQYVQDVVETKLMGRIDSTERTAEETLYSRFWASSTVAYFWNTVGERLSQRKHLSMSENARFFAYLNIGMADAAIACWDAKYHYSFWRPITAITLASTDGNDDTVQSVSWLPLLDTPNHPDYLSGHSTVSGGAIEVLSRYFGPDTDFWIDSDGMPGVIRTFSNFDQARDEIANARIFSGIHFRSACEDGFATGAAVGDYLLQHGLTPLHGHNDHDDD